MKHKSGFCLLMLAVVLALVVPAAARAGEEGAGGELRVLATTFPVWLFTRNVVGDDPGVTVDLLIPAGAGCPHDYAPTPRDARSLEQADIVVKNGLGMENFLGDLSVRFGKDGPQVIEATAGVGPLLRQEGDGGVNPHLFASPRMAALMVIGIGRQLADLDPARAERYRANARAYAAGLDRLADRFAGLGDRIANNRIVTRHGAFDYLARDAGLVVAAVLGHEAQEPSAAEMMKLVREIREKRVGAVFVEPQYPVRVGRTLAEEAGVPAAVLDPVASGPADAPGDYYQTVMIANLRVLEDTLGIR